MLPIEVVEEDLEADEVEEEAGEVVVVDSEEEGDEGVEEDSKDCVGWLVARFDDHYAGDGDKKGIGGKKITLRMFALLGYTDGR